MSDLNPTEGTVDAVLEAAAAEAGIDREELLKHAIIALAEDQGVDVPDAEEVASLESRVDALDADLDEKVGDLRERFIELYRELESTATADHTHAETAERLDALAADLDRLAEQLDTVAGDAVTQSTVDEAVEARAADLDDRLSGVEARVDDLSELEARVDAMDVDEIDDKLSRVASAVVRVRRRLDAAERDRADRERLDALSATANRNGIRKAACTDCGEAVNIGLLTEPECPHCGRAFADLEPNPGFLGTSRLVADDQPALDGDVDDEGDRVSTRDVGGD